MTGLSIPMVVPCGCEKPRTDISCIAGDEKRAPAYWVHCHSCRKAGPAKKTEREAVLAWNAGDRQA